MLKSLNLPATNYESQIDDADKRAGHNDRRQSARTRRDRRRLFLVNFHAPFNASYEAYYDSSQAEECDAGGNGQGRFVHINGLGALQAWRPTIFGQVVWECEPEGQTSRSSGGGYVTGGGPIPLGDVGSLWRPIRPRYDILPGTRARVITNATATTGGNIYGTGSIYPSFGGTQITTTLGGNNYNTILPLLLPAYAAPSGSSWSFLQGTWGQSAFPVQPVAIPDIANGCNRGGQNYNMEWFEQFTIDVAIYAGSTQIVAGGGGTATTLLATGRLYCQQTGTGTYFLAGYITGASFTLDVTVAGVVTGTYGGYAGNGSSGVITATLPNGGTVTFTLTFTQDSYHRTTGVSASTSGSATCVILAIGGPGSANQ
jgi:hypothetical protein